MARIPVVSRTITSTEVTILCINTSTREISEVVKVLPRTYANNEAILKFIDKNGIDMGENVKPVSVVSTKVKNQLYKMLETKFVELADPVDALTEDEQDAPVAGDDSAEAEAPKKSKKK